MLDRIKATGYLTNISLDKNCRIKKVVKTERWTLEKRVPIIISNSSTNEDLILWDFKGSKKYSLVGNLRKWLFGEKSAVRDLNNGDYVYCMYKIAKHIGTDFDELMNFEINYLELGGNLKMSSKYSAIIPSLIDYPQLKRDRYNDNTVYFKGSKYIHIYYSKLDEMYEKNKIKKTVYDNLSKHVFVLRYEKKIRSKSGVSIGDKIKTFKSIQENWNFLVNDWFTSLVKANSVDLFSGTRDIDLKSLTPKELIDYFAFQTIKKIEVESALTISKKLVGNRRYKANKSIIAIHDRFSSSKKRHYFEDIAFIAKKKADKMKIRTSSFL